ncbi:MAG: PAC2 family protein [Candidatus Woesearchaeota archaeon]
MEWAYTLVPKNKPKLDDPVLIEGLPGIGNVGKIAVDYIIEKTQAQKLYTIYSHHIPHSVFVTEDNLVEMPRIEIYYKKFRKKRDLLLLTGETQPIDEPSCFSFCESILKNISEYHCKEIITMGGIGLRELPKNPTTYITGTSKEFVKKYKTPKLSNDLYGKIGPIVGVSGVLVALSRMYKKQAISVLGETIAHPMYIDVRAAKEILTFINDALGLDVNLKYLDGEIKEMETQLKAIEELEIIQQTQDTHQPRKKNMSYIG